MEPKRQTLAKPGSKPGSAVRTKGKTTAAAKARPASKAKPKAARNPKTAMKPTTIDEYFAGLSTAQRTALERVRRVIRATAPAAQECISYQIPSFKLNGKGLIWFGAAAHHCAIYGVANDPALQDYDTSGKGTLRFTVEKPLPDALLRKLVKARMKKIAAKK
jgi:uncharacterized protein YdhG (YjbR/CyaY superfamily)